MLFLEMDIFRIISDKQYVGKSNWGNNLMGMIDACECMIGRYH